MDPNLKILVLGIFHAPALAQNELVEDQWFESRSGEVKDWKYWHLLLAWLAFTI